MLVYGDLKHPEELPLLQAKGVPRGEEPSAKVSYTCGRRAIRGGSYDG
jgi:hypothetical protein